jgi:hypothetical protein
MYFGHFMYNRHGVLYANERPVPVEMAEEGAQITK